MRFGWSCLATEVTVGYMTCSRDRYMATRSASQLAVGRNTIYCLFRGGEEGKLNLSHQKTISRSIDSFIR